MVLCTSSDKGPYMSGVWWLNVVRFRRFARAIVRPEKKKNNKDSTEIRKTIKDSNVLESFNNNNNNKKDSTEIRKIIKDSEEFGIF